MAPGPVRDDWLRPTLESLLSSEALSQLNSVATDSLWEAAVQRAWIKDDEILTALASRFRMKIANLLSVSQQARELVPEQLARKYRILPLAVTDSAVEIATADPYDLDCERTLAFALGRTIRMSLASPIRIADRIEEVYRPEGVVDKILENVETNYDVQAEAEDQASEEMDLSAERASERPIIRLVDHVIADGIMLRASDIHLEPEEAGVAVRYRIDGVLQQVMTIPRAAGVPLVSRIKIISGLDIADRLRPQDGRSRVTVNGARIDLRVSTLPSAHGEKVVIRILDQRATVLSLDALGLNPDETERINQLLGMREGIILVTGPTGSGKTTTLYSVLRSVQAKSGVNIVTVEDPVEYRLQGVVQVQVNEKAGMTFATALRSILRQDPDVVLVGEIRDRETASTAVQASLTGHLVLSTLHTIDAAGAVTRLVDIGVETYKIAAALKGIIAQRLLRKLCPTCKELWLEAVPERLRRWIPAGTSLYRAVGCDDCGMTGYRGRRAITEVLLMSPEVERRIAAAESSERISDAAREGGMKSLFDSGLAHVKRGDTSLDELLRVVELPASATDDGAQAPPRPPAAPSSPQSRVAGAPPPPPLSAPPRTSGGHPVVPPRRAPGAPEELAFQLIEDGDTGPRARKTVLVVEDEHPLRRLLRDMLEREGFIVLEADNGVAALDEIDRGAPDLVVLDLNLPQLDGYGVLSHLRARPATAHLPVIVLTAQGDEDSEVRVLEFGANDFMTKPFRPRALSARIQALLARR